MSTGQIIPPDRIEYVPIHQRERLDLPGGARVAVWLIVNIEEWSIHEPMPRTVLTPPAGGQPSPDVPNWAWHEYGNRVGFWRLLKIIDGASIPAVMAINGKAVASYPEIAHAAVERDWEFIGHGYSQKNMQKVDDERLDIRRTADEIETITGKRPRGWLGPGLTETWETPDLLVEEGYEYVCDWVLDDQPVTLRTRTTPIVNIPYTQECNDVAMMLIQHHQAGEYYQRAIDQFDQLYMDSTEAPRVMALVVHPYIMGAPHRAKYLRMVIDHIKDHDGAVFTTGEQILDHFSANSRSLTQQAV